MVFTSFIRTNITFVDDADKVLDSYEGLDVRDDDDDTLPFDDEDAFLDSAIAYEKTWIQELLLWRRAMMVQ